MEQKRKEGEMKYLNIGKDTRKRQNPNRNEN